MNTEDTRFYLAEIIMAVESLHKKGIIYRDLKPENVLLDRHGHVKLIDFGFAKKVKNIGDRTYTNCGTPGYCAPEVMLPTIGHTYKADIWSIGILICEMLGGFIPFQSNTEARNPTTIMEKCRNGNLNLPKNLSPVARDLVKHLLVDDPEQRLEISLIKSHPFFNGIDWLRIFQRVIKPPNMTEMKDSRVSGEFEIDSQALISDNSETMSEMAVAEGPKEEVRGQ
jgi:serine/threonine protein kinase